MIVEPRVLRRGLQSAVDLVFARHCMSCDNEIASDAGLCGSCWRQTPFIHGLVCDKCGTPLPGEDAGQPEYCDDCLTIARPWHRGRAALIYKDNARAMILALKHGDRIDLARQMAGWLAAAAGPLLTADTLIVPIPLHRTRLFLRRYNQAAELSHRLARRTGTEVCPDFLLRSRQTGTQDGRDRDGRFANVSGAFAVHPGRRSAIAGRPILLVDDVMTSGATFAAAAEACHAAGAGRVSVLALARVAKDA